MTKLILLRTGIIALWSEPAFSSGFVGFFNHGQLAVLTGREENGLAQCLHPIHGLAWFNVDELDECENVSVQSRDRP